MNTLFGWGLFLVVAIGVVAPREGVRSRPKDAKPQLGAERLDALTRGCDAGRSADCFRLAIMFHTGSGVTRDLVRTAQLYKRACNGGHGRACENLAVMHAKGETATPSEDLAALWKRAVELYTEACDGGSAAGCTSLGLNYAGGTGGLTKDLARALSLFQKACAGGNAKGCRWLGVMYEMGEGVSPDRDRATRFYERALELEKEACAAGDAEACDSLEGTLAKERK